MNFYSRLYINDFYKFHGHMYVLDKGVSSRSYQSCSRFSQCFIPTCIGYNMNCLAVVT